MTEIESKYQELGGEKGLLGAATALEQIAPDGVGRFRRFQNGAIHWHPNTGAHETHGAILGKWADLQWETGPLGYPATDEVVPTEAELQELMRGKEISLARRANNRCSHFQHGRIFCWSPDNARYFTTVITADHHRTDDEHVHGATNHRVVCPSCSERFTASDFTPSKLAIAAAGAATGGYIGSGIGIATGGTGFVATIPLALGGGLLAFLSASKFTQCPKCKKVFKI